MSAPFLGNETEISGREKQPAAIRKQNHRYKSPHRRILRLDTGQHVYQLKLSRCMFVFRSRFIRVRMVTPLTTCECVNSEIQPMYEMNSTGRKYLAILWSNCFKGISIKNTNLRFFYRFRKNYKTNTVIIYFKTTIIPNQAFLRMATIRSKRF